ncbi:tyrosine-type recombinase/integrase [Paraburkholderia nemoris]|uniref:tyrosine-type recombinase/integrase n=1 Tax=Paraburkholderia nemoris TaxID=2793076 RepID=UPI0038BD0A13
MRLLLQFVEQRLHRPPERVALSDLDAPLILEFLNHLEVGRNNSIRSRNLRLAAIRSFLHYAAFRAPESLRTIQQVLAIPTKRYERPLVRFLSRDEICALLDAPDPNTWCGQRDRVMLATLYNTGARASELIGIRVGDVELDRSPSVRLHGKGRKERAVPLLAQHRQPDPALAAADWCLT